MAKLDLNEKERLDLEARVRNPLNKYQLLRAKIVLGCAGNTTSSDAELVKEVAHFCKVHGATVRKWRSRYIEHGLEGLEDKPRSGAPDRFTHIHIERLAGFTLHRDPNHFDDWTTRELAAHAGMSPSSVSRLRRSKEREKREQGLDAPQKRFGILRRGGSHLYVEGQAPKLFSCLRAPRRLK